MTNTFFRSLLEAGVEEPDELADINRPGLNIRMQPDDALPMKAFISKPQLHGIGKDIASLCSHPTIAQF